MKFKTLFIVSTLLATTAFAQQSRVELISRMSGSGKGKVTWKTRDSGGQFQAELEAEGENLRRNTSYRLDIAGGKVVVNVTTDALGRYHFVRNYRTVVRPRIVVGDRTVLRDRTGALVHAGVFAVKR